MLLSPSISPSPPFLHVHKLTDEWIKKLWYIYTMKYYSAIKRSTSESVLMRWMNLEPIIQSEVSQKEKDKYCVLTHISENTVAPHSSTLAWKIPWMEEPGRLQSMVSLRIRHRYTYIPSLLNFPPISCTIPSL